MTETVSAKHQIVQIITQWVPGSRASNSKCPTTVRVAAQPGDDDWQNEDVVDWPFQR